MVINVSHVDRGRSPVARPVDRMLALASGFRIHIGKTVNPINTRMERSQPRVSCITALCASPLVASRATVYDCAHFNLRRFRVSAVRGWRRAPAGRT
ncbi:MAG TPA: hypothetical protein VF980_17170, partial [Thermoanaerobaculia bacterium]